MKTFQLLLCLSLLCCWLPKANAQKGWIGTYLQQSTNSQYAEEAVILKASAKKITVHWKFSGKSAGTRVSSRTIEYRQIGGKTSKQFEAPSRKGDIIVMEDDDHFIYKTEKGDIIYRKSPKT